MDSVHLRTVRGLKMSSSDQDSSAMALVKNSSTWRSKSTPYTYAMTCAKSLALDRVVLVLGCWGSCAFPTDHFTEKIPGFVSNILVLGCFIKGCPGLSSGRSCWQVSVTHNDSFSIMSEADLIATLFDKVAFTSEVGCDKNYFSLPNLFRK